MNIRKGSSMLLINLTLLITGCQTRQTLLEKKSITIINVGGFLFKDHNKNGKVDIYEDWRVSSEERARDLLNHMSPEEKAGMVIVSQGRMKNELSSGEFPENEHPSSDFNENDLFIDISSFTGKKLPDRVMQIAGTTKAINDLHIRHFIVNTKASPQIIAEWSNKLQEKCENSRLGIPALISSDPRNLVSEGRSRTDSAFSKWPSEAGLAAMRDMKMVRIFAEVARQEWLACGLRKCNFYAADLGTEPRWQSFSRTAGENSELTAEMVREIVQGFQGSSLSDSSVSVDVRHFPGGGSVAEGYDPHHNYGKNQVFPGGMFKNNLVSFRSAIVAGAQSLTTYYSSPRGTEYSEVAYAYNRELLRGMLREILNFRGTINASSESVFMIPWGAEKLTIEERYSKILEAGVNSFEGIADPDFLIRAIKTGKADIKNIDESVLLLLKEIFDLGLFENPYVDEESADIIHLKNDFRELADIALRKSIVLLRNDNEILPLRGKTKIYFEILGKAYGTDLSGKGYVYDDTTYNNNYIIVGKPEDADISLLWLKPFVRPVFPDDSTEIKLSLSSCAMDTGYINNLSKINPVIIAINYSNPFVIDEVYNENSRKNFPGVLATFGTSPEALLDIVTGKFKPDGKMPFSTPFSEEAVRNNKEDVPGFLEGEGYALFRYDEGLNYRK